MGLHGGLLIANIVYELNGKAPLNYHKTEIATMDSLRSYIFELKDCCLVGAQKRGPSCSGCAFSETEFITRLESNGFLKTECNILNAINSITPNNTINRLVEIKGSQVNVDTELHKYVDLFKSVNPTRGVKIITFKYPDQCPNFLSLLSLAVSDTAGMVILATIIGDIGKNGALFIKVFEKDDLFIKPNGPGNCFFYDLQNNFLFKSFGNLYHGIYFKDWPYYPGLLKLKEKETYVDAMAKYSSFYLSDSNIAFLKNEQIKNAIPRAATICA
jgi:hypothetical protein